MWAHAWSAIFRSVLRGVLRAHLNTIMKTALQEDIDKNIWQLGNTPFLPQGKYNWYLLNAPEKSILVRKMVQQQQEEEEHRAVFDLTASPHDKNLFEDTHGQAHRTLALTRQKEGALKEIFEEFFLLTKYFQSAKNIFSHFTWK